MRGPGREIAAMRYLQALAFGWLVAVFANPAQAQEATAGAPANAPNLTLPGPGIQNDDLVRMLKQQQEEIEALKKRLKALEAKAGTTDKSAPVAQQVIPPPPSNLRVVPAATTTVFNGLKPSGSAPSMQAQATPTPPVELPNEQPAPETERPSSEKPTEQLLVEQNAILLPRGTIQLEPGIDYERFGQSAVNIAGFTIFDAIVIGTIRVDRIDRDVTTASLTGRYAVTDRIQLDAKVPYVYRTDTTLAGVGTSSVSETTIEGNGIGDINAGITYQPLIGHSWIPDVLVRAQGIVPTGTSPFQVHLTTNSAGQQVFANSPTGNGYYGAGLSTTLVWRTDPLALFMGGGYTYNFAFTPGAQFGRIKPGDNVNWFLGANVALNDVVSLNVSMQTSYQMTTTQNNVTVLGSDTTDARFVAGASIAVSPKITLVISGTAGLTSDAPNFGVTLSLPISF